MRIKFIALTALVLSTLAFQPAHAEGSSITAESTWEEVVAQLETNSDITSVFSAITTNNAQFLAGALGYLANNNPDGLIVALDAIKKVSPEMAASALATISALLANDDTRLKEIQSANPNLMAQILNSNIDVLPAAGPTNPIAAVNFARAQAKRAAAAENRNQSSPN